jgi:hypothetical protein
MIGKIGLLQGIRQKFSKENLKIAKRSFASKSKIFFNAKLRFTIFQIFSFSPKIIICCILFKFRESSSNSPQSSLSSGSLAPNASGVSYSCASVEQLFSQMKLPELHMSPFREPRPIIATSSTTNSVSRAAGQSRPPASMQMSHHSSKHASSKSGNLIKERCLFFIVQFFQ